MRNKNFRLRRMFINIRTRLDYQKIESVIYETAKAKLLVCFKYVVLNNIVVITNKQNNVERVCIAIKADKGIEIEKIVQVSARIIVANVLLYGCFLRVICCYAPTEEDSDSSKNIFYNKLNKQFEFENTRKTINLGYFNASSSATWYNSSLHSFFFFFSSTKI